jgi:hypothetical protein
MLILRFKETFRDRMPEWVQSFSMLGWGLISLAAIDLFESVHLFNPLLLIMSQTQWAFLAIFVGFIRLVFLFINGAWRPSAHIRAIGCVLGVLLWGSLLVSTISLPYLTPQIVTYSAALTLEVLSLWFAAGDAKLADLLAKKHR